ncbi:glycogen synthase GlgA [Stappia sp. GBMRC 2046]|uniref:Glycogen synthase n=1 Tax=Stappia sediminis TaxID=2692190 RepID=A0A7X3LUP1_9HYPH|nr:glycogen synthase GlgA [Stappia sediminis]MXN65424.1 glycogen synthase GlgA [Stappia sediminis]
MEVLFVGSECAPFVKTGGLADVIGVVPKALTGRGVRIRVLLPAYQTLADLAANGREVTRYDSLMGGSARVVEVKANGLDLLLLEARHLFDRPGNIYLGPDGNDWGDNAIRFGALCQVGADLAEKGAGKWKPDIVHVHDWQAGLVPLYLRQRGCNVPCVVSIHNVAFQGLFDAGLLEKLGISKSYFTSEGIEYYGRISFLKAALVCCEKIATVSPTYARELMSPEFGMGLEGVLQARRADLSGILNGIDLDVWNPETDPMLPAGYNARSLKKKGLARAELAERFGLEPPRDAPLFCVISRLTSQKGLDLLVQTLPALTGRGAALALLGTGEKQLEDSFLAATRRYPRQVGAVIGYDEALSHLMQGGADAILIPSRFEPCGLTQLYGLRYGTIPVVSRTGGLADTVIDANEAALIANCATGLQFSPVTAFALENAIHRTCDLFAQPQIWSAMIRRAMKHPVGWENSAKSYAALYAELTMMSGKA